MGQEGKLGGLGAGYTPAFDRHDENLNVEMM